MGWIAGLLLLATGLAWAGSGKPEIGKPAPDFELADQDSVTHTLSDYRDQWVLLYFYPKDDTPGCTAQACGLRDGFEDFGKIGATVIGISADDVESHKAFAEKYNLPFTLLADTEARVIGLYGVKMPGLKMARRTSFLIAPDGTVTKIYENVEPASHPDQVLKDLEALKNRP
ncbi:MAG TPA: peroxiredoxin [bacterium]|nr:peroxiredoxin [bacterium]